MPSQQKPKAESKRGQRNGDRRNGKGWGGGHATTAKPARTVTLPDGKIVQRSYYGYSHKRILRWVAESAGSRSFDGIVWELMAKNRHRLDYRSSTSPSDRKANRARIESEHYKARVQGQGTAYHAVTAA